jgi:hypothetical protein
VWWGHGQSPRSERVDRLYRVRVWRKSRGQDTGESVVSNV